jgi:hypothetical protein
MYPSRISVPSSSMRRFLFWLVFLAPMIAPAQVNLIPNPSFEDTVSCPSNVSGINGDQIYNLMSWFPANNSPDYFNSCANYNQFTNQASVPINGFGYQSAFNGNGYVGLFTFWNAPNSNYKEHLGVQLIQPLTVNNQYYFSAHVATGFGSPQTIYTFSNNLGIKLSTVHYEAQTNPLIISNTSTAKYDSIIIDTLNWTLIQFSFIADSAYMYLYIGNFYDYLLTDTVRFQGTNGGKGSYYYIDNVCLSDASNFCGTVNVGEVVGDEIGFYPNPASNQLNFKTTNFTVIKVINIHGSTVMTLGLQPGNNLIDVEGLSAGVYILRTGLKNQVKKFIKL